MRAWRFDQETDNNVVELPVEAKNVDGAVTLNIPAASGTMLVIE